MIEENMKTKKYAGPVFFLRADPQGVWRLNLLARTCKICTCLLMIHQAQYRSTISPFTEILWSVAQLL